MCLLANTVPRRGTMEKARLHPSKPASLPVLLISVNGTNVDLASQAPRCLAFLLPFPHPSHPAHSAVLSFPRWNAPLEWAATTVRSVLPWHVCFSHSCLPTGQPSEILQVTPSTQLVHYNSLSEQSPSFCPWPRRPCSVRSPPASPMAQWFPLLSSHFLWDFCKFVSLLLLCMVLLKSLMLPSLSLSLFLVTWCFTWMFISRRTWYFS